MTQNFLCELEAVAGNHVTGAYIHSVHILNTGLWL